MQPKINVEDKKISELVPYENNARKHSKAQIQQIADSITTYGYNNPILIDTDNGIVAGHGRVEACKLLGWQTIPAIVLKHLDSKPKKGAYIIADNKIAENATWDTALLAAEFTFLQDSGIEMDFTGFDMDEINKILNPTQENADETDDQEEENKVNLHVVSRTGDIWLLGNNRLMCGNSTSIDHVEKLFKGAKASFCFTSPPYADQREYNGETELAVAHVASFIRASYQLCDLYAVNLGMSRKDSEVNCYWNDYIEESNNCGLKLLSWNIWNREGSGYSVGNIKAMFAIDHEWIFVFGSKVRKLNLTVENKTAGENLHGTQRKKDGSTTKSSNNNPVRDKRQLGTVLTLFTDKHTGEEHQKHPAAFPVALPVRYIEACTAPNDTVYEPFGGSGTTLIACEKTKRKCLIMEIDEGYCDIILRRWEKLTGYEAILEETGQSYLDLLTIAKATT